MSLLKRLSVAACVGLAALSLSGCGRSSGPSDKDIKAAANLRLRLPENETRWYIYREDMDGDKSPEIVAFAAYQTPRQRSSVYFLLKLQNGELQVLDQGAIESQDPRRTYDFAITPEEIKFAKLSERTDILLEINIDNGGYRQGIYEDGKIRWRSIGLPE